MDFETRSFALHEPMAARHPYNHKPIKVVGVDDTVNPPEFIALVSGDEGELALQRLEYVHPEEAA